MKDIWCIFHNSTRQLFLYDKICFVLLMTRTSFYFMRFGFAQVCRKLLDVCFKSTYIFLSLFLFLTIYFKKQNHENCPEIEVKFRNVFLILYGMDSINSNWGTSYKKLQKIQENWGIYSLSSVKMSRVLRIIASQNIFESLYDEMFNIDRFVE